MRSFSKIFSDSRHLEIFIFAIFSGAPLAVLYRSLAGWLSFAGVDVAIITTFAISKVFYSMKFFWSPLMDQIKLPLLSKLGHRKSWMILCLGALASLIFLLSTLDPVAQISYMRLVAIGIGLASASFDIVFDAFRIEKIGKDEQSAAAANVSLGWQLGAFIGGGSLFLLSDYVGWSSAFLYLSQFMLLGIIFVVFLANEPILKRREFYFDDFNSYKFALYNPFYDFFKRSYSVKMLLAVILFKAGDAFLGAVATKFYYHIGFSSSEVAYVATIWGVGWIVSGTFCFGLLMYKCNISFFRAMIITGIAQSVTNASFIWLNHMGHDITAFTVAIAIENFASGMGNAALVAFLSSLCNRNFSATQYALLTSASGLVSHVAVIPAGALVNLIGYDMYFLMTILIAFPGIALFIYLNKKITIEKVTAAA